MAESNTTLVSNEWKQTLETIPTKSTTTLVSLWDLLYVDTGDGGIKFWTDYTNTDNIGTKLSHDIICYNRSMVQATGTIDNLTASDIKNSTWWTYGIDMSLPKYDGRSKSISYTINDLKPDFFKDKVSKPISYTIYDKEAALPPANILDFTKLGVKSNSTDTLKGNITWVTYEPPTLGVWMGEVVKTIDIYVSCQDTAFTSTLVTQDSMSAYNRIFLNPSSIYARALITKLFGLDSNALLGVAIESLKNISSNSFSTSNIKDWKEFYTSFEDAINKSLSGTGLTYKYVLQNTFVWVRAPFFADYIIPESFNQDLNQTAKVKHSELMLSGSGDFNRYDNHLLGIDDNNGKSVTHINKQSDAISDEDLSESSVPYLPRTTPLVDFYTSNFVLQKGLGGSADKYSTSLGTDAQSKENLNKLINVDLHGNDMPIRGLPAASVNRSNKDIAVPGWLDPESNYSSDDYLKMGRLPTVLPKDGNLYVGGRIISSTTDEINYVLREIISGRPSDVQSFETASEEDGSIVTVEDKEGKSRISKEDIGIPLGTHENENRVDTSLSEVVGTEYNFSLSDGENVRSVHGSPIDFMFEGNYSNVKVTKYVNQNDSIVYPVYKALKSLSSDVTTHIGKNSGREITDFTAWKDDTKESVVKDGDAVNEGMWAPRDVPFSLRELEAMIKANKFNLTTLARFMKENYTVAGKLGKVNGEKDNLAAGSLYQMHKDYNFDVTNPNTYYNNAGTDNGLKNGEPVGAKALIDDEDIRSAESKSNGNPRYAQDYGTSDALMFNPENYSSSDVYLSASGEWRYVSDHNRIPVLRSEY